MGKMELSPAERERRSLQAKKQHEEGKLGGPNRGQGRPKKPRASEHIAEQVAKDRNKIKRELWDILENGTRGEKLKAITMLLEVESKEQDRKDKEGEDSFDNMDKDTLLKYIGEQFVKLKARGIEVPGIIEGEAREI